MFKSYRHDIPKRIMHISMHGKYMYLHKGFLSLITDDTTERCLNGGERFGSSFVVSRRPAKGPLVQRRPGLGVLSIGVDEQHRYKCCGTVRRRLEPQLRCD